MEIRENLLVGARYRVVIDDCCVNGEFEAILVRADEKELRFDNGISFSYWACLSFEAMAASTSGSEP